MTRDEIKLEIKSRIPCGDYLTKSPHGNYECPFCGSGTGVNGHSTGALNWYKQTNTFTCFSCGKSGDVIDLHMQERGLDFNAALADLAGELGLEMGPGPVAPSFNGPDPSRKRPQEAPREAAGDRDYTEFYKQAHEDLKASQEALKYLHDRGITDESIDRFNLGYCAAWKHSKALESVRATKRIIMPRTARTYTARRIDEPANEAEAAYKKQVQGTQKDLFNLDALEGAGAVFVCEGELDAISLYQAGAGAVVGIGTTTNTGAFLDEARKHPEAVFILALDNDPDKDDGSNPGKKAQRDLAAALEAAGLAVLNLDPSEIYGKAKDGNEALTKDPERLQSMVASMQGQAQEIKARREEDLSKRTGEAMLEDFLLTVTDKEKRTFEPIPTGIRDVDRALEGGFTRKTLVTLGAPPAMGKTAVAQWIFENIAASGKDVLYINLEMSREQLLARSISRLGWKHWRYDFSALDVLRGYQWTEQQQAEIMRAADKYKAEIAPHFIYNPDGVTNNIDSILGAMRSETARIKGQGKPAPLVCLDYLQLVDSGERDAIEGMKNVIFKLKKFAKDENTVVLTIIANNRASNKTGDVDMESGRDTSAIEYNGDVMLGLVYTAIADREKFPIDEGGTKEKVYDLDDIRQIKKEAYDKGAEVPQVCKRISLKVMKNRFGDGERHAKLIFDGKHSTFEEAAAVNLERAAREAAAEEWAPVENKNNPFLNGKVRRP